MMSQDSYALFSYQIIPNIETPAIPSNCNVAAGFRFFPTGVTPLPHGCLKTGIPVL
jgi:hypothetical protein